MGIKYSKILTTDEVLSAGPNDIVALAIVDASSSTGYTTKVIKKSNLITDPLFTSLTTTGTTGAATLVAGVLNIPQYGGGIVDSVTGLDTDNTDPANPIINIAVDGVTITGAGTIADPLVSTGQGLGVIDQTLIGNRAVTMAGFDLIFTSVGDPFMLFLDAPGGNVGIGNAPSLGKLHVDGTIASNDNLLLRDSGNGNSGILTREALVTSDQTWTLPDNTGTIALEGINVSSFVNDAGYLTSIPVGTGGIYGGSGTIPATVVATLTDNIEFAANFVGEANFILSNSNASGSSRIKIAGGTQSMSLYTTLAQGHIITSNDPNGMHIASTTANTTMSSLAGTIVDITAVGDIQIVGTTDTNLFNTDFANDRVRIGDNGALPVKVVVRNTNPAEDVFTAINSTGTLGMTFKEDGVFSVTDKISVGNASPSSASRIQTLGDIEITQTTAWYYLGDPTTDGSWRFGTNAGADFLHQKRELGVWVTKQTITP
jgi:hypothetical protein